MNKKCSLKIEVSPNQAQNKTLERTVQAAITSKLKLYTLSLMDHLTLNNMCLLKY